MKCVFCSFCPSYPSLPLGAQDLLSVSSLDDKSSCQVQAAHFLCHVYINWSIIHSTEDVTVVGEGVAGKKFDIKRTLVSLLSEHDKSKATNLQIVRYSQRGI